MFSETFAGDLTLFGSVIRYGHKHIYDENELRAAASAAGWFESHNCRLRVGAFREGVNAALAQLDDKVHQDESIYVDL
jgi:hypothetical protein